MPDVFSAFRSIGGIHKSCHRTTGSHGGEIYRLFAERKLPFRALVRETTDPAKIEHLKAIGVQIVKGDIRDLHSLKSACLAVDTVITTVSAMPISYQPGVNDLKTVDTDGAHNLVEAAKSFGVRHIIYTSFSGNMNADCPLVIAKHGILAVTHDRLRRL